MTYEKECRKERIKGRALSFVIGGGIAVAFVFGDFGIQAITVIAAVFAFLSVATLYNEQAIAWRVHLKYEAKYLKNHKK